MNVFGSIQQPGDFAGKAFVIVNVTGKEFVKEITVQ
jgi:hypothetical protein